MAEHARSTHAPRSEADTIRAGRRSLFGAAATVLLTAPIAAQAGSPPPTADFAPATDLFTETAAERALWRCLGVIVCHMASFERLADTDDQEEAKDALCDRMNAELEVVAAVVPDTRQAFRLKAMVVHRYGDLSYTGERVAQSLVANLIANGGLGDVGP